MAHNLHRIRKRLRRGRQLHRLGFIRIGITIHKKDNDMEELTCTQNDCKVAREPQMPFITTTGEYWEAILDLEQKIRELEDALHICQQPK